MDSSLWKWDSGRKAYYYFDRTRKVYVYQDKSEIAVQDEGERNHPASPNYTQNQIEQTGNDALQYPIPRTQPNVSQYSFTGYPGYPQVPNVSPTSYTHLQTASGYGGNRYGFGNESHRTYGHGLGQASHHHNELQEPTRQQSRVAPQTQMPSFLTDAEVLQKVNRNVEKPRIPQDLIASTITPHLVFRATPGNTEKLNPSFKVQYPGYAFFKRGVVFRVLWPELAGDKQQNITIATTPFDGEKIFCKIRWFVVVREGHNCCTCLSIQTYRGRGVPLNKPKYHHAIMYTGATAPYPEISEQPQYDGDPPLGDPIRVIGNKPWDTMDLKSRVNFLKPYTVEHNVKVELFGCVDKQDERKLISQFNRHWSIPEDTELPSARAYGHRNRPSSHSSHPVSPQSTVLTSGQNQEQYHPYGRESWNTGGGMQYFPNSTTAGHQYQYSHTSQASWDNDQGYHGYDAKSQSSHDFQDSTFMNDDVEYEDPHMNQ